MVLADLGQSTQPTPTSTLLTWISSSPGPPAVPQRLSARTDPPRREQTSPCACESALMMRAVAISRYLRALEPELFGSAVDRDHASLPHNSLGRRAGLSGRGLSRPAPPRSAPTIYSQPARNPLRILRLIESLCPSQPQLLSPPPPPPLPTSPPRRRPPI